MLFKVDAKTGPDQYLRFIDGRGGDVVTFTADGKMIVPERDDMDYAAKQFLEALRIATGRDLVFTKKG